MGNRQRRWAVQGNEGNFLIPMPTTRRLVPLSTIHTGEASHCIPFSLYCTYQLLTRYRDLFLPNGWTRQVLIRVAPEKILKLRRRDGDHHIGYTNLVRVADEKNQGHFVMAPHGRFGKNYASEIIKRLAQACDFDGDKFTQRSGRRTHETKKDVVGWQMKENSLGLRHASTKHTPAYIETQGIKKLHTAASMLYRPEDAKLTAVDIGKDDESTDKVVILASNEVASESTMVPIPQPMVPTFATPQVGYQQQMHQAAPDGYPAPMYPQPFFTAQQPQMYPQAPLYQQPMYGAPPQFYQPMQMQPMYTQPQPYWQQPFAGVQGMQHGQQPYQQYPQQFVPSFPPHFGPQTTNPTAPKPPPGL